MESDQKAVPVARSAMRGESSGGWRRIGGEVEGWGSAGEAMAFRLLREGSSRRRDAVMVGWRRKRRSCCQRACCAIRRVVER